MKHPPRPAASAARPAPAPLPSPSLCSGASPLLQLLACPRGAIAGLSHAVCSEISAAAGAKLAQPGFAQQGRERCITPTAPGPFRPGHPQGKGLPAPCPQGRGHGELESLLPNREPRAPTCELIFPAGTPACGAVWGGGWRQHGRGGQRGLSGPSSGSSGPL